MQQQKAVQGKVLDQTGSPIIGASVLVKGTMRGTITNVDGNFSIDVAKGETLVISYIGYVNQEIVPTGKNLSIVLKEDNEVLDEVVVLGYGANTRKQDLSASV
ncbi:MAG: carboxypeptidase-like regulatory domain-containing protein, partial [Phocaeicola sp.]|nr:carboxypeptidase-like regulatory domain-containing protein [Phocaeicola sp.]